MQRPCQREKGELKFEEVLDDDNVIFYSDSNKPTVATTIRTEINMERKKDGKLEFPKNGAD